MGIVNVTPDSFSDGGRYLDPEAATAHAVALLAEGADIVDVGGESTRPGAQAVAVEEELARVQPVIAAIAASLKDARAGAPAGAQISIDTSKAAVARAAVEAGASMVNDVSAFRFDPEMAGVVAGAEVDCCLMHMLGEPRTMQDAPRYGDVVDDVKAFLEQRLAFAVREGVPERHVLLDPGIGFGKTIDHNLELLRRLDELLVLGRPLVIGTSRKSFLGRLDPGGAGADPALRLPGTLASNVLAFERGATVFRVHDVAPVRAALTVAAATLGPRWSPRIVPTRTTT